MEQTGTAVDSTLAEQAYRGLRADILRGAFTASAPLRLAELSARYGMGFSPLREALNRLQAERLVTAQSLRGFRVPPHSLADFEDAHRNRLLIETQALRDSIALGDDQWATGLVAASYALRLQADRPDGDLWELEARHHAFHRALLAGCGSEWLMAFFERLHGATERFRLPILQAARQGHGATGGRDIQGEHAALAEAALARDAGTACALLADHYERTARTIRAALAVA